MNNPDNGTSQATGPPAGTQGPAPPQANTAGWAASRTSRALNYDALGRTARFTLTARPLQREQLYNLRNEDFIDFLTDNNVQVPPNSSRKHLKNVLMKVITQNPMLPHNYQPHDREKDRHAVSQALMRRASLQMQSTSGTNPSPDPDLVRHALHRSPAPATVTTSTPSGARPPSLQFPTTTRVKNWLRSSIPAVPTSNAALPSDGGRQNCTAVPTSSTSSLPSQTMAASMGAMAMPPRPMHIPPGPWATSAPSANTPTLFSNVYMPGHPGHFHFHSQPFIGGAPPPPPPPNVQIYPTVSNAQTQPNNLPLPSALAPSAGAQLLQTGGGLMQCKRRIFHWQPPPVASNSTVLISYQGVPNRTAVTQQVATTIAYPPNNTAGTQNNTAVTQQAPTTVQPAATSSNQQAPIPPPALVQNLMSTLTPAKQNYLKFISSQNGGWNSPVVQAMLHSLLSAAPAAAAQPVAVPPKQKPLPPLVPRAGAPPSLQPQAAADNSTSGASKDTQAADAKDVEVISVNGVEPGQGCQAIYIETTEDSADWEVPPSCECNVSLHSLVKHAWFPIESVKYLESMLPAPVGTLVQELTNFGQGEWARSTGCRLLLLTRLRALLEEQVQADPAIDTGPQQAEDRVPATGTKRKAGPSEKEAGEEQTGEPREGARKRRKLQEGHEPVVWPTEYKPVDTMLVTREEKDFWDITEKMNHFAVTRGRVSRLNYNILQIERVWNEKAYRRFTHHLELIREENGGVVNEFHLFHGSSRCREIAQQGFDERHSYMRGMFGAGVYFAEHSFKSNNYVFGLNTPCPTHGSLACTLCVRQMLLCRVALGKMYPQQRAQHFAHPPPGYHSVQGLSVNDGGTLNYPEYVVYRGEQALPEFLISYVLKN